MSFSTSSKSHSNHKSLRQQHDGKQVSDQGNAPSYEEGDKSDRSCDYWDLSPSTSIPSSSTIIVSTHTFLSEVITRTTLSKSSP